MFKKIFLGISTLFILAYIGLGAYFLHSRLIEELLICAGKGGINIPFSNHICLGYIYSFRGTKEDIEDLQKSIGASFITQEENKKIREGMLKWFVAKGLNINSIGHDQLTALHRAVLFNSPEEVKLLLDNGADPNVKDERYKMTPLEYAHFINQKAQVKRDLSAVIIILDNVQPHKH